jgi:hypothetical protein
VIRGAAEVVLFAAAFHWLGAAPAGAQAACAVLTNPDAIPADVYSYYDDVLAGLFPLGPGECDKVTKGGVSACHKAVDDAAGCWSRLIKSLDKGRKTSCKSGAADPAECDAIEVLLADGETSVEDDSDAAHAVCDGLFAVALFDLCTEGPPPPEEL